MQSSKESEQLALVENQQSIPWLGVIADDVTGAADLAAYVTREGIDVLQYFGVPDAAEILPARVGCVVIALKSRSIDAEEAVRESLLAYQWLISRGVGQVYFKYCSTFDSTALGNIGPVADALVRQASAEIMIFCPSAPENKRTVYQGKLFVGSQLLEESSLRNHPINPMLDSDVPRLLSAQSKLEVSQVSLQVVRQGASALRNSLASEAGSGKTHIIVDAIDESDLDIVAQVVKDHAVISGSAGLAAALARIHGGKSAMRLDLPAVSPAIIISGSCSSATQNQVEYFRRGHPSIEVDAFRLAAGDPVVEEVVEFLHRNFEGVTPLIFSTADAQAVSEIQHALGIDRSAQIVEKALSDIAQRARDLGIRRFIVAGGETSGAIVKALDIQAIRIGNDVAPGVPWAVSLDTDPIVLVLKSGNFGQENFFDQALKVTQEPNYISSHSTTLKGLNS